MAKLPDGSSAEVPRAKVTEYLLSPAHPVGRSKAAFFKELGFSLRDPDAFVEELKRMAAVAEVTDRSTNGFGTKWVLEDVLVGPDGKARVRTVWFVPVVGARPRLVTAYPARDQEDRP